MLLRLKEFIDNHTIDRNSQQMRKKIIKKGRDFSATAFHYFK